MLKLFATVFCVLNFCSFLSAQTIAEKKASLQKKSAELDVDTQTLLTKVNQDIRDKKVVLRELFLQAKQLHDEGADPELFRSIVMQIQGVRKEILALEQEWQNAVSQVGDGYALWHQPETTLEELVLDYGAQDYVYLIPPEVSAIKLSVNSNLPVPRAVWNEMLEQILNQSGVGIRQLNPFLRELYFIRETGIPVRHITSDPKDLVILPKNERIAFIFEPDPTDIRRIYYFMEKFTNAKTTVLQLIGREILIIAQVGDIQDLMKMAQFVGSHRSSKEYRLVPLRRVKAKEMAQILSAMFDQMIDLTKEKIAPKQKSTKESAEEPETNGLKVVIVDNVAQAIFLVGTREEIDKAELMIQNVEARFRGSTEKIIWWYTAKHSSAEDLALMLQRVYTAMITRGLAEPKEEEGPGGPPPPSLLPTQSDIDHAEGRISEAKLPSQLGLDGFYQEGSVAINPAPVTIVPRERRPSVAGGTDNFIVDVKTGTIVMVVEVDILPKLQEVIKKVDVPKKMVQIEVLLAEKRITDQTNIGLNLLRLGTCASQTDATCLVWNDVASSLLNLGILQFVMSRMKTDSFPAFDLAYRFLLSQDDVHINANPSVMTINQVPARIAILDEISVNTGVAFFETSGGVTPRDSFTRAQYGTTLVITPTIHEGSSEDWEEDVDYITLETDVNFDTFQVSTQADRPNVTRRNISNEVLIPDGQTVILGGLRRLDTHDVVEKIPFLGEIPGFGKFFSNTRMTDTSVEMFIFITPKIIYDPTVELQIITCEQMKRRPGDSPDFMMVHDMARKAERNELFAGTTKMLLGRGRDYYFPTKQGMCESPCFSQYEQPWETRQHCEYDGRE